MVEKTHIVVISGRVTGIRMRSRFRGNYSHAIDTKGRIIIPVKFREALGESIVVTKGFDGCLYAFPQEEWEAFEDKLRALPLNNQDARQLSHFFIGSACEAEPDKQGRILLPQSLLAHAGIGKEAVVVGMGGRLEIWSAERWERAGEADNIDDIASAMNAYGLSI